MTPPKEEPEAAMPMVVAILVLKYVDRMATPGTKRHPQPIPTQIAWERRTCQYVVDNESIICPKTTMKDPTSMSEWTYPAS